MKKKFLAAMMSAVLLAGSFTGMNVEAAHTVPAENQQQIVNVGGSKPAATPTTAEDKMLAADGVKLSKTIAPTDKENYFDITLQIQTPEEVSKIHGDTAVVLVIDKSTTMNLTMVKENKTRLQGAKDAACEFVNTFNADKNLGNNKKLAVVAFNTDADVEVPMTTLSNANISGVKEDIKDITPVGGDQQWTNIEAGLQLAYNILNTQAARAEHRYVVLLTDGFPTTYLVNTSANRSKLDDLRGYNPADTSVPKGQDGAFFDNVKGVRCIYGTSYSDTGAQRATTMAQTIKNAGINIMSVGINIGQDVVLDSGQVRPETIDYHNDRMGKYESVVERSSTSYVIGSGSNPDSYKNWVGKKIGGGKDVPKIHDTYGAYQDGNATYELNKAYADILAVMDEVVKKAVKDAWFAADPMGDNIEFMEFYDSENKVSYTDKINWDLKESPCTSETVGNKTTYTYELKYKVRLENEADGFAFNTANNTNGTTTIKYIVDDNGKLSAEKTASFPVPAVEGYKGELSFKKTGKNNAGIKGAEFTLSHTGTNCGVCGGDADIDSMKATSDANGKVTFTNIPSGHDYTLKETKAPEGYILDATVHTVDVDYGKTYLDDTEVTSATAIANEPYAPVSYQITASKTMTDDSALGTYTFVLKDADGTKIDEKTNDGNGAVAFDSIEYDAPGTYTYTVSEVRPEYVQGGDQNVNIIYDEAIYGVEVTVGVNSAKTAYEVKSVSYTKIAGGETDSASSIVFGNKLRGSAKVEIAGTKTMDAKPADENAFTFELKDAEGNLVEAVKNGADGKIKFSELTFDTPGTYNYTITEVNAQDEDVVYDKTVYDVEIVVTCPQNNSDDYQAAVKITSEDKDADVAFVNSTRKAAEVVLTATKEMNGETPEDGQFYFTISGDGITPSTKSNVGKLVTFEPMYFENAGTYRYTISEVKGFDPDTVYDTAVYEAIVTISVPEDGGDTFDADVVWKKDGKEFSKENTAVPFENFSRKHTTVPVEAVKTMDGEPAAEGEFTFVLEPSEFNMNELNTRQEVKNGADGIVKFADLEFGAVGTYIYHMYEVKGDDPQVIYDDVYYNVVVEVTAPENGEPYQTEVKYELVAAEEGTDAGVETILFENVTRESAVVILEADKTLDGKVPEADTFVFELKDAEGNVLQTKTNDAEGNVVFDEIVYDEAGIYEYTITEKDDRITGVKYDESVYAVTVEVTVDTENKDPFQAAITVEKDGEMYDGTPLFENVTIVETGDNSNIGFVTMITLLSGAIAAAMVMMLRKRR